MGVGGVGVGVGGVGGGVGGVGGGVGGVGVVGVPMVGVPYGLREDCIWLMLSNSMRFQDLA